MKRAALTFVATLALLVMMAFSATAAMACASWEDPPPASTQGQMHRSDTATAIVADPVNGVTTGANSNAFPNDGKTYLTKNGPITGTNPGNK